MAHELVVKEGARGRVPGRHQLSVRALGLCRSRAQTLTVTGRVNPAHIIRVGKRQRQLQPAVGQHVISQSDASQQNLQLHYGPQA